MFIESEFPELFQALAAMDTAQREDIFRSGFGPKHARLSADEVTCGSKGSILHAFDVAHKVFNCKFAS
jgi:hypothetical protein